KGGAPWCEDLIDGGRDVGLGLGARVDWADAAQGVQAGIEIVIDSVAGKIVDGLVQGRIDGIDGADHQTVAAAILLCREADPEDAVGVLWRIDRHGSAWHSWVGRYRERTGNLTDRAKHIDNVGGVDRAWINLAIEGDIDETARLVEEQRTAGN